MSSLGSCRLSPRLLAQSRRGLSTLIASHVPHVNVITPRILSNHATPIPVRNVYCIGSVIGVVRAQWAHNYILFYDNPLHHAAQVEFVTAW